MRRPAINWNLLLNEMDDLLSANLNATTFDDWINSWSHLASMAHNDYNYWSLIMSQDCADQQKQPYFHKILADRLPTFEHITQQLAQKLLDSDLQDQIPIQLKTQIMQHLPHHSDDLKLKTKEHLLIYEYQQLICQHIVSEEHPYSLIKARSTLCQCPDRQQRKQLWHNIQKSQAELNQKTAPLLIQLIQTRNTRAKNAGHKNYIDYLWSFKDIANYSVDEANLILEHTAQYFSSISQEYSSHLQDELDLKQLQPWDLEAYPLTIHSNQIEPTQDDFMHMCFAAMGPLDPEFPEIIQNMSKKRNIDLAFSPDKNPQSLACFYAGMDEQFIVGNLNNHFTDIGVVLNAFGQSIHSHYSNQANSLFWMKEASQTVSYFVAYTFQALGIHHLSTEQIGFLNLSSQQQLHHAIFHHSCQWLQELHHRARFEHWLYLHIDQIQDANDLNQAYLNLCPPQNPIWQGFETEWSFSWNSWAIFNTPFASIEHLMAWLSSMRFLDKYKTQPQEALLQFKQILSLGNTSNFKDTLDTLGLSSSFQEQDLKSIQEIIDHEYHSSSFTPLQKRHAVQSTL